MRRFYRGSDLSANFSRRFIGLAALLAIAGCGKSSETDNAAPTAPNAPTAPVAVGTGDAAARGLQDVLVLHDKSAGAWLNPAADTFNQSHPKGKIFLTPVGSREGRDTLLYAKDATHPEMWIPGDNYWIDKLRADSANPKVMGRSGASVGAGKDLLHTYVVLVVREDRASVLEAAMRQAKYAGHTWRMIAEASADGWTALGGPAEWGKLKMAQASPLKTNSGMLTLALMYREFRRDNSAKNYDSPEFAAYIAKVEGSVPHFAETTSDALKDLTENQTTDKPDIAVAYESEALTALEKGLTGYRIVYPAPTFEVSVPVALVTAAWVTDAKQQTGRDFIYYLQSDAAQQKALDFGYRPVAPSLAPQVKEYISATKRQAAGFQPAPQTEGTATDSKEKEGLIYVWGQWYAKATGK